ARGMQVVAEKPIAEIEYAAACDGRADPRFAGSTTWREITSQAHPNNADATRVDIRSRFEVIDHRRCGLLPLDYARQMLPNLALTGSVKSQGCQPSTQEHIFER